MSDIFAVRVVRLAEHPWFDQLRHPAFSWAGVHDHQEILVVATRNGTEWAVYYETPLAVPPPPTWPMRREPTDVARVKAVALYGNKVPEDVARELFGMVPARYRD